MKRIVISVASLLAVGAMLPGLVYAQTPTTTDSTSTTDALDRDLPVTTTNDATTSTVRSTTARASTNRTIDTRTVEERTAERAANREAITSAIEARIAQNCETATTLLSSAIIEAQEVRDRREIAYATVAQKLDDVIAAAATLEVDVATLETHAASLDTMVAAFFVNFDSYQQALDDTAALDCASDAQSFYYAVVDARESKQALKAESKEIKSFFQDDIRSTLADLKDEFTAARGGQ